MTTLKSIHDLPALNKISFLLQKQKAFPKSAEIIPHNGVKSPALYVQVERSEKFVHHRTKRVGAELVFNIGSQGVGAKY